MGDTSNKTNLNDIPDETIKLSPQVPEKVLKMWFVEDKKNNFQVKKVSEIKGVKAILEWDSKQSTIKNSVGDRIKVYPTFRDAAENAILKKIEDKKKKWESYVKASYIINNEIGELYESLHKLQEKDEDD